MSKEVDKKLVPMSLMLLPACFVVAVALPCFTVNSKSLKLEVNFAEKVWSEFIFRFEKFLFAFETKINASKASRPDNQTSIHSSYRQTASTKDSVGNDNRCVTNKEFMLLGGQTCVTRLGT